MRRLLAATIVLGAFAVAPPASANTPANPGNPSGTGPPSQTCLASSATATEPGNAANSPGSPFHEPNPITGDPGGTGGQNYNAAHSQYDVACYHVTQNH